VNNPDTKRESAATHSGDARVSRREGRAGKRLRHSLLSMLRKHADTSPDSGPRRRPLDWALSIAKGDETWNNSEPLLWDQRSHVFTRPGRLCAATSLADRRA